MSDIVFKCIHFRSGKIGTICNIEACFTKLENPNTRELTDTKYGGSFLELGSYVVFPILKIFGTDFNNFFVYSSLGIRNTVPV